MSFLCHGLRHLSASRPEYRAAIPRPHYMCIQSACLSGCLSVPCGVLCLFKRHNTPHGTDRQTARQTGGLDTHVMWPRNVSSWRSSVLLLFLFSALGLRAPSADRPEALPHDRKCVQFCNPGPEIRGAPNPSPEKNVGAINLQHSERFRTTSDFDR